MFNIADFSSELNRSGTIRKSNYQVFLLPRKPVDSTIEQSLLYRCIDVTIPGYSLFTSQRKIYGAATKVAYDTVSEDISLTILVSEDLREKTYFEKWKDTIVGDHGDPTKNPNPQMWDIGYYDDYVADVNIKMYSDAGKQTFSITAYSAYPATIGNLELSYDGGQELLTLPVTITYAYTLRK